MSQDWGLEWALIWDEGLGFVIHVGLGLRIYNVFGIRVEDL